MKKNQIINIFLLLSNALFVALYVVLCFNNRLAADDFHFLANVNEHGVIQGTIVEYAEWSSRWLSVLLNHFVLFLYHKTHLVLALFGLFNLFFFVSVVWFAMRTLVFKHAVLQKAIDDWGSPVKRNWWLLNYSVFIVGAIFIATVKINETWFWLCASTTYLWSNILLILGMICLFYPSKNIGIALLGSFSFFYLGGSSGPLALLAMLFLGGCILGALLFIKRLPFLNSLLFKRSILFFVFCMLSFLVLYFAEGNHIREQFFQKISLGHSLLLNVKMSGIIFLKRLPFFLPLLVVWCIPVIRLGGCIRQEGQRKRWKAKVLYASVLYVAIVYLFQLPITYKTQDVAAYRALFFVTIISLGYVCFLYFVIGNYLLPKSYSNRYLLLLAYLSSSLIFGYELARQYRISTNYAKAYDQRMALIKAHDKTTVLALPPLPESGMLYSAEISQDTAFFSNQHLKKGLQLNHDVSKKEQ